MIKALRSTSIQQRILAGMILIEIALFACIGQRFLSVDNLFTLLPLNAELALVALALTPIIVSGGIDLSVGSTLGLCAVCFGKMNRDWGWPTSTAVVATLVIGLICGGINALFIARLRVAPLIATLGTLSLYRGIAEGMTRGVANYTNFPPTFLSLGQGTIVGVPSQLYLLLIAIAFYYLLLHRMVIGRALSTIGFAPDGARYAGLAVERSISIAYLLSGLMSAVAALIYVARVGQAKADAGNGYELSAITAVVLGGTSIFGGRGSIVGTLMGLLAIALLENGLRLADLSPELAGILKGVLLLAAIGIDWKPATGASTATQANAEELEMRNGQLAVLCVVILVAAGIIALTNFQLVKQIRDQPTQVSVQMPAFQMGLPGAMMSTTQPFAQQTVTNAPAAAHSLEPGKPLTIAMMPKSKGNAYFISCRKGAEEAASELHDTLLWDGPTDAEPAKQNEIVDTWITRGVDVIAVSVDNRDGLSTALRKARAAGIKVITWDADALPDARDNFVNQATAQGIGNALMDNAAKAMSGTGEFAIITASLTSANQNEWIGFVKDRMKEKYPNIKLATIQPCDDLQPKAFEQARTIMNANPNVKLIMAVCSPAVPGAAEAVKQAGRSDVHVVGLGLPNDNKPYVHSGITTGVVLWNTTDLGYLTVHAADDLVRGQLKSGTSSITAGRLGPIDVKGDNVMLGTPFTFDASNIDRFDF